MPANLDGFIARRVVCFAPTDGPADPDDRGVLGRFAGARSDEVLWSSGDVSMVGYEPGVGYFERDYPTHRLRVVSRRSWEIDEALAQWRESNEALEAACQ